MMDRWTLWLFGPSELRTLLHDAGRPDRAAGLDDALHRDLVAVLQRRARRSEHGRAVGHDVVAVDPERDCRTRALLAAHRSLNLEQAADRVVLDLNLAGVERSVALAIADDVQRHAEHEDAQILPVTLALHLG